MHGLFSLVTAVSSCPSSTIWRHVRGSITRQALATSPPGATLAQLTRGNGDRCPARARSARLTHCRQNLPLRAATGGEYRSRCERASALTIVCETLAELGGADRREPGSVPKSVPTSADITDRASPGSEAKGLGWKALKLSPAAATKGRGICLWLPPAQAKLRLPGLGTEKVERNLRRRVEQVTRGGVEPPSVRIPAGHPRPRTITVDRRSSMFKRVLEFLTLRWLWDRRGGNRGAGRRR